MFKEDNIEKIDWTSIDEEKLKQLGLSSEEIDQIENPDAGGTSALVYFVEKSGRSMAIKKDFNIDPLENSSREHVVLRLLEGRGGRKISPHSYYSNNSKSILITERIHGEKISELQESDIKEIAALMAFLHKPTFRRFGLPLKRRQEGNQLDRINQQIDFLSGWLEEMSKVIELSEFDFNVLRRMLDAVISKINSEKIKLQDNTFSLIHYDLNPNNIIRSYQGNILFLDWRQAFIGDRAADVAKFFYKNYLNNEQKDVFWEEYLQSIDDETIKERAAIYDLLVRLGSILWRLRFINIDSKKNPQLLKEVDINIVQSRLNEDINYLEKVLQIKK